MVKNDGRMPDLNRAQVIHALRTIRQEWEEACKGSSTIGVSGSVGLLIGDVVSAIGFEADEMAKILGSTLTRELDLIN